jgi:hypothetical protein
LPLAHALAVVGDGDLSPPSCPKDVHLLVAWRFAERVELAAKLGLEDKGTRVKELRGSRCFNGHTTSAQDAIHELKITVHHARHVGTAPRPAYLKPHRGSLPFRVVDLRSAACAQKFHRKNCSIPFHLACVSPVSCNASASHGLPSHHPASPSVSVDIFYLLRLYSAHRRRGGAR